jgi:predicted ATP-grasp superfamily ATP-dependent carboligase
MNEGLTFIKKAEFEKGKKLIQLFNGSGMIGSVIGSFLVDQFHMKYKGYFSSRLIPAYAVIKDGIPDNPVRLFENEDFLLLLCDVSLSKNDVSPFVVQLYDWYDENEISEVIIFGGVPLENKIERVTIPTYVTYVGTEMGKLVADKNLPLKEKGSIFGSIAVSQLESVKRKKQSLAILAECIPFIPDYAAAAKIVEVFNKTFDLDLATDTLWEEFESLKEQLELVKRIQTSGITDDDYDDDYDFRLDDFGVSDFGEFT